MFIERPHFIACDALGTPALEMFSIEKQRSRLALSSSLDLRDTLREALLESQDWLPLAAESYNISANIKDYILQPVISMPSDLPNRNQQAFPFTALSAWTPDAGCVMYKTWNGKPVFEEHNNQDHTKAKGIIFSTLLKSMAGTNGDIWKVIKLVGFDRSRDPVLANEILLNRRNNWSMGAYARSYTCSICGKDITKSCGHLEKDKPNYKLYANNRLAYWNVVDPFGFEISNVKSPAYASASDTKYFTFE